MNRNQIAGFVSRWLDAVQQGNSLEFEHLVSATVVDLSTGEASSRAAFQARASLVQRAFSELEGHVDELLIDGDRIAWRWTLLGVHRGPFLDEAPSGKRVRLSGTNFQHLAGGVVVAHYTLVDALGALQQLRGA